MNGKFSFTQTQMKKFKKALPLFEKFVWINSLLLLWSETSRRRNVILFLENNYKQCYYWLTSSRGLHSKWLLIFFWFSIKLSNFNNTLSYPPSNLFALDYFVLTEYLSLTNLWWTRRWTAFWFWKQQSICRDPGICPGEGFHITESCKDKSKWEHSWELFWQWSFIRALTQTPPSIGPHQKSMHNLSVTLHPSNLVYRSG